MELPLGGLHVDSPAAEFDLPHRRCELSGESFGELGDERADALATEGGDVAFGRTRYIHDRDLGGTFAASKRTEHELDARTPLAQFLGQSLSAGDVGLPADRVGYG